jgi:hypothetical protein
MCEVPKRRALQPDTKPGRISAATWAPFGALKRLAELFEVPLGPIHAHHARPVTECGSAILFAAFRGGPQPVHKNEPRPTPGLSPPGYLAFALAAAAVRADGSAKAITASPSAKLLPGSPPKP